MQKLRVGLIGAGGIAGAHVKGYLANPDLTTLVAVADPVAENAQRRADLAGADVYSGYLEMLEQADIDAVDICLPHHLHLDAIVAAARAGKHILCEKPLCLTPDEARVVADVIDETGVTLMCAHNQLFAPSIARARTLLDEGLLGKVYEVRTTDSFYNDFDPTTMGWRGAAATSGGGELIDTGYHPTYLLMYLAGGRATEAAAMLSNHRLGFMEGEDSAQVLVRFDNDVVGTITTSWAYAPTPNTERFSVVGELGSMYGKGEKLHYRLHTGEEESLEFEPVEEFTAEIRHFAESVIGGTKPIHSHLEGIEALGIILAAYQSARTKSISPVLSA